MVGLRGYAILAYQRFTSAADDALHIRVPAFAKVVKLQTTLGAFFSKNDLTAIGYDPTNNKATAQFFDWLAQPHLNRGNFATEVRLKQLEDQVKQLSRSKEELEKQIIEMKATEKRRGKRKQDDSSSEEPAAKRSTRPAVTPATQSPPVPPTTSQLGDVTAAPMPGSYWAGWRAN